MWAPGVSGDGQKNLSFDLIFVFCFCLFMSNLTAFVCLGNSGKVRALKQKKNEMGDNSEFRLAPSPKF